MHRTAGGLDCRRVLRIAVFLHPCGAGMDIYGLRLRSRRCRHALWLQTRSGGHCSIRRLPDWITRVLKNAGRHGALLRSRSWRFSFSNYRFHLLFLAAGLVGYFGGRHHATSFHDQRVDTVMLGRSPYVPGLTTIRPRRPTPCSAGTKFIRVAAAGLAIWGTAMGGLFLGFGGESIFTQAGWFFTKAALLTFGGAYAVLPYIYQGAVEHYQWLAPNQMIDGLALGETTPGLLIMVVTFVGFVGGWVKAALGPDTLFASAFIASAVATFFTFLPSFIFILLGGPFIETTHGNLKLTAPLTGITAAVVGIIVNLALFFAYHVFWPNGMNSPVDVFSVVLAAVAMTALFRFKAGVIPVILGCGIAGMAINLLTPATTASALAL